MSAAVLQGSPVPPQPAVEPASPFAPRLPVDTARRNIASYVHRHGVVLTRGYRRVGTLAPATLCRILRAAVTVADEGRRQRAEMLVRAIALSIIKADGQPLWVSQTALDVLWRLALSARCRPPARPCTATDSNHGLPHVTITTAACTARSRRHASGSLSP